MELSKFKNHRDPKYLKWLREQKCVVSGKKAQCAHHIRLGTNGGSSLKPSDYFCIPLINSYHTTGSDALHIIGEDTFLKKFNLNKTELFIYYLSKYLMEKYDYKYKEVDSDHILKELIDFANSKIITNTKRTPSHSKKPKSEKELKLEELKKENDKRIRKKIKKVAPSIKVKFKGNPVYERAKELKKENDKKIRENLKPEKSKTPINTEFKEAQKKLASEYRKKQYKKLKELKKAKVSS